MVLFKKNIIQLLKVKITRNIKRVILIILFISTNHYTQDMNIPLTISGKVINSKTQYISEENFHFKIFLNKYSASFLSETSPSCGYQPPVWFAELGNLEIDWNFGDTLTIILEDYQLRERIVYNWAIDSTARIPDLQTQTISSDKIISGFNISDRGVINGIPVTFSFHSLLSQSINSELKIFNEQGIKVYQSAMPEQTSPNDYCYTWYGKSNGGAKLRSGIYFYFFSLNEKLIHSGIVTLKNE